ncbi:MAG TPA: VWA domain-containing protein [Acidobacteriaceae bacterium]|jgi:VWFA-related protein|nr:VWA domain-containing protein [Acidobacteriaceae bacterium]
MVLGKQSIGAIVLAGLLAATGSSVMGQQTGQTGRQATSQQQPVPNAPTPQTLPQINTITPAAPNAPVPQLPNPDAAAAADNGGITPGATLPSAPAPTPQAADQEPAPELPAPGQGASAVYHMGVVHVDFVQIPFTVLDSKGKLVPGLTWRDVRIYENGLRQHMSVFTDDPFPLSVALVIDQSVTFDTMEKINTALSALQGAFTPYDEVAVFTYNSGVKEQTTYTAAQSPRLGVILDRSKGEGREPLMPLGGPLAQTTIKNNQQVDPNTTPVRGENSIYQTPPKEFHTLLDAVFTAAQSLSTAAPNRRRIIFVISDGKEYGSHVSERELVRYLQTNKIGVYATLVGDSSLPGMGFLDRIHLPLTMRDDVLPRIANATGGDFYGAFRPRAIETSFSKISETVRYQYTVGYYTHLSPLDNKFRHIEVRVMKPGLTVLAEDGYYPTPRNVHPGVPVTTPASATPPTSTPSTPPPATP